MKNMTKCKKKKNISTTHHQNFNKKHKNKVSISISFLGSSIGTSLSHILSGFISEKFGWPFTFYFFGLFAIGFSAIWHFVCHNCPEDDPNITQVAFSFPF